MKTLKNHAIDALIIVVILVGLSFLYVELFVDKDRGTTESVAVVAMKPPAPAHIAKPTVVPPDLLAATPKVILKLHGSNTIGAKLVPALAAAYLQQLGATATVNKPLGVANEVQVIGFLPQTEEVVAIEIKAHGSSTGFKSLIAKTTDIAMSSRHIRESENLELLLSQGDMTQPESEHIIALDGLAVITHEDNPVKQLTVAQLAQIFAGEITNWSRLGGPNQNIRLYARDDQSGTYDTFKSLVLKRHNKKLSQSQRFESNALLAQAVENDPAGIGFTGLAYARPENMVYVAADEGIAAIKPEQFTISSEDYALSRRLYLYANKFRNDNPHIQSFIEFSVSMNGQKLVEQVSFIPQKITATLPVVTADHPPQYQRLALNGERLSMTFRMRADRAEIDNKSVNDIEHLVSYLQRNPYRKVALIGFSAGESDDVVADTNRSFIRSKVLAHELKQRGVHEVEIVAMGNQLPIDSNNSETGRYKNNRTEVWLIRDSNGS